WEYAARAGAATTFWYGDAIEELDRFAWYRDNAGDRPHGVGRRGASGFGLYDMMGNLFEWTLENHGGYTTSPRRGDGLRHEPVGGGFRVVRGGGWGFAADGARSAFRYVDHPGARHGALGFRPVVR
ncbi:MAG: SUMF1/EgtB/PvdO family nonheme iron enzyme, partial [Myxococcales bacterium]|nr:SUMF1/EgtB/PvdO family nonheme iron enzyme [Myxococcales bacterium]